MLFYAANIRRFAVQVLRKQTIRSFSHLTVQRRRYHFQLPRRHR